MRKTIAALVLTMLATLGAFVPAASAAGPKAVVIVGATHSATADYRASADVYYNVLREYTSNVVRIYSPNATWSKVKSELQGASIVIYLGHGNGFPSPYSTSPRPLTQNGFGLNYDSNGDGKLSDYENRYYGEQYIAEDIRLAPNAVVLFNRLCYASGNDETGGTASSVGVAKARVDNYAAGFIAAGARAVIADAIGSLTPYLRALFTTRKSVDQIWREAPNFNNRVLGPYESLRNPGFQFQLDPDSKQRYYRSIAGDLSLTADEVTGTGPTDVDPSTFVVPGAAEVGTTTGLYATADLSGEPQATLAAGTALRVEDSATDTTAGSVLAVRTLDGDAAGFADATALVPRDSYAPALRSFSGGGRFDPGADGATGLPFSGTLSENAAWSLNVRNGAGDKVFGESGSGTTFSVTWAGTLDGKPVSDGFYTWKLSATDEWGNAMPAETGTAVVDSRNRTLAAGSSYTPIDPTRFLDTRSGNGLSGTFDVGKPRKLQVAGRSGVPADAVAVTANVTIVNQTAGGYVTLSPIPDSTPSTSTINFPVSDIRANGVVVRLDVDGTLAAVYKGAPPGARTHVVLDVTGYYRLGSKGTLYSPVTPERLLDTREGNGLAGVFAQGEPRTFQVGGRGAIPADAVAVTGNLTVTDQTAAGYVTLSPVAAAAPTTSTLNFPVGDVRANNVVVPLAADGSLSAVLRASRGATTHLVFDVTGYYRAGAGSLYVPLAPARLLDTREANGLTGAFADHDPRSFGVAGRGGVPASAVAVTGNLTVTEQTYRGFLTLGPTVAATPTTSTLNFPKGDNRANGAAIPLGSGTAGVVYVAPSGMTHVLFDVDGYFKAPG